MYKKIFLLSALLLTTVVACKNKPNNAEAQATAETTEQTSATADGENGAQAVIRQVDPNLSGAEALETIKKNYTGKVAFFDFWATWCPPCRAAMRDVDQIKPELQKQGAVFVYITGETSPEDEWKNSLTDIHGDHYRLTDKQWNEINNNLHVPGIPAYFLLDRKGEIAFENLTEGGYPGNEVVKEMITKALNKK
ncbi:MAG: TlpA family protein disulfide reductase [Prevotellaceae bacterium]|nr:TlpA family protein disulfide reductase [Prevotellaceae bacterium]